MDTLTIIACVALGLAAIYLITAAVMYPRLRRQEASEPEVGGQAVLTIADRAPNWDEPTPDRMRKLAGMCATISDRVFSSRFDFSLESVTAVDRAIAAGWGNGHHHTVESDVIHSFGAYLGEVMVRHSRGRWVTAFSDDEPGEILFLPSSGDADAVNFSPFRLVREKFDNPYGFDIAVAFTALQQRLKELNAA